MFQAGSEAKVSSRNTSRASRQTAGGVKADRSLLLTMWSDRAGGQAPINQRPPVVPLPTDHYAALAIPCVMLLFIHQYIRHTPIGFVNGPAYNKLDGAFLRFCGCRVERKIDIEIYSQTSRNSSSSLLADF
ncbi:hypothetical protein J6590_003499 [Homalodisca vitripennis]|nr:hypothetical protein J6590_091302 [Homalodisca vitripennis]KAG8289161.1 hypothetical protein J6590_003499 [Homalodisca vitripennis]